MRGTDQGNDPGSLPVIKGVLETSFLDWPGRICAVLFLGGCNFRCPFCHNHPLVLAPETLESYTLNEVLNRLAPYRKWLDGLCITGGEPTLDSRLPGMLAKLKSLGWAVKLDTNGSRPEVLASLLDQGVLDMVAMDVKAPLDPHLYNRCAGVPVDLARIGRSISLIRQSAIDHEFRMTVVPGFHSPDDIVSWGRSLAGGKRLTLQNFNPRTTLDPDLELAQGFAPDIFDHLKGLVCLETRSPCPNS